MAHNFDEYDEKNLNLKKMIKDNWSLAVLISPISYDLTREINGWCKNTVGTYPIGVRSTYTFSDAGEWYFNSFMVEHEHRCVVFFKNQEMMTLFAIAYGHLIDWIKNYEG